MMKRSSLLTLALIGVAGLAQAQTATGSGSPPLDPQGRPYVGANDWRPGPGDPQYSRSGGTTSQAAQPGQPGMTGGQTQQPMPQSSPGMAGSPSQAMAPDGMEKPAFKDEYGFMYNSRGDRVDARGRIIAPPQTPPGAAAR